jgi:hypothetical protein
MRESAGNARARVGGSLKGGGAKKKKKEANERARLEGSLREILGTYSGYMYVWMDGWMDGCIYIHTYIYTYIHKLIYAYI